jgi:predicted transposase YbfD/YdcC
VLAGAETFTDIARFGDKKLSLLRRFRPFHDGTPPHDRIGDIFAALDAEQFQRCFVAWVASITGIPAGVIAIEGAIVTIDATGCQREIARAILDKKADYVLALKGNQGSLREDVEVFAAEQQAKGFADTAVSQETMIDGDHGRIETRTTTVINDVGWLQKRHDWPGLQAVVVVDSRREINGKTEREKRFYLTS